MGQLSLYIEDTMLERLNLAAKAHNSSVSKYVVSLVNEQLLKESSDEITKKRILLDLKGAIDDETFVVPEEIPWDADPNGGVCIL